MDCASWSAQPLFSSFWRSRSALGCGSPIRSLRFALVLVILVPFTGTEALGPRRWLSVGGWSFQPTELMKVALVLALARYYQWLPPDRVSDPKWVLAPLLKIAVPVVLTLRQPDLG
jgi:rod shape determining protein RodA